jgi:cupin 2 domain-containing protein
MRIDGGSLFPGVVQPTIEEQFTELARGCSFRCERIVSHGHVTSPGEWFDQPDDEWVVLLTGSATLAIEGEATFRELHPGDWLLLPAHRRHRVERTDATQPTIWLAIHFQREKIG